MSEAAATPPERGDGIEEGKWQISIRKIWNYLHPRDRALALNEIDAIDRHSSNYLELAALLEKWCQANWKELPRDVRGELGRTIGIKQKVLEDRMQNLPAHKKTAIRRALGVKAPRVKRRSR